MSLSDFTRTVFANCKTRSEDDIARAREAAQQLFGDTSEFVIGVNGSYARREVTGHSDIDYFFLGINNNDGPLAYLQKQWQRRCLQKKQNAFRKRIEKLGLRPPATGGVFDSPLLAEDIYQIGGQDDRNDTLTRRMLLLLEGEWLFNPSGFDHVRRKLLEQYLYDQPQKEKICLFLLNDIIRYWRTICTDLEHKIRVQGKPPAIRFIKLRFSRMLLYVSGVLTIWHGHGLCYEDKIHSLCALFAKYPINRILFIAGAEAVPVLDLYAEFLEAMDTPSIRGILEKEGRNSEVFEEMRNKAGVFRDNLHHLFRTHFAGDDPTRRGLLL